MRLQVDSTTASVDVLAVGDGAAQLLRAARGRARPAPAARPGRCGGRCRRPGRLTRDLLRRRRRSRPCAARGRPGSAARWTGRPCVRRRRRAPKDVGAKLRMLRTPAATSRSQTACAATAGRGDDADADTVLGDHARPGRRSGGPPGRPRSRRDGRASASSSATMRKPRGGEAGVVRQRVAQVADPDDGDRPVLGQADLAGDLVARGARRRTRRRGCRRSRGGRGPCAAWRLLTPGAVASPRETERDAAARRTRVSARRYTGRRATVASGIPRRALWSIDTMCAGSFCVAALRT